jgi:hypothetical protein
MTKEEYSNLKSNSFVEYMNQLGIYKNDFGVHSILLPGNEQIELSIVELIKNVTISDIKMKTDGFYFFNGEIGRVHFNYDVMTFFVEQKSPLDHNYNLPQMMEINKQNMLAITENDTLKEVNQILNIGRFIMPCA